jgi:hypothetical protein
MGKRRILAEQLEYVVTQRNLGLARKKLREMKKKEHISDEELALYKARLESAKEKASTANDNIIKSGLSKGNI